MRTRGPHPHDAEAFAPAALPRLRTATAELSWLLTRGYATPSALKLVGDRHALTARQRRAVQRCACSDDDREARRRRRVAVDDLAAEALEVDGFNLLITLESALCGAPLLRGRDGALRDMASVHGSYRQVAATAEALERVAALCARRGCGPLRWLLDRPVSNSGRLAARLRETAARHGLAWTAELVADPDVLLKESAAIVVSADSAVLDGAGRWCDLAAELVGEGAEWLLELGD